MCVVSDCVRVCENVQVCVSVSVLCLSAFGCRWVNE